MSPSKPTTDTRAGVAFPQTVAIPAGLEIHPSIPADLASEMLRVADLFHRNPELYDGRWQHISSANTMHSPPSALGCGCICAHIAGHDKYGCSVFSKWAAQAMALQSIFVEAACHRFDAAWAIARITTFLETAK